MNAFRRLVIRRCFSRRSWFCFPVRWLTVSVVTFLSVSIGIFLFYSVLIYYCCSRSSDTIVSLTSTPKRFTYELPIAVYSLLAQTVLPKEIRIYLSPSSLIRNQSHLSTKHLKLAVQSLDSSSVIGRLFDQLVQIRWEENDFGPATKFLPIIREFHSNTSQAIVICDDDHYYHPHVIETLNQYAERNQRIIVGLRGWRIREDLTWGVNSVTEISYHIIQSFRLSHVYRVGVVTANCAYLIRPSFFDPHFYQDFSRTSEDIRRVDDIWLNGHAARRNISRYVVPSCCPSVGITRTHELENYLTSHQMSRSAANDHALKYFEQAWERDLWYRFHGDNRPKSLRWWQSIYRQWLSLIIRVKITIAVGFV